MHIAIAGNIGAGKTTLTGQLAKHYNWDTHFEDVDDQFAKAVALLAAVEGRVIVSGMGKSGHIGSKIAATLASTGTPAQFVHPAEACHGDMGMITRSDAALLMSNSGTTSEITALLPLLKRLGIPIVPAPSVPVPSVPVSFARELSIMFSDFPSGFSRLSGLASSIRGCNTSMTWSVINWFSLSWMRARWSCESRSLSPTSTRGA